MDALVDSDTQFHEVLIDVSGRRRLKDLWSILNSQMGALMRAELERQGITMDDTVGRHISLVEAATDGDLARLRAELRVHYLEGFPQRADAEGDAGTAGVAGGADGYSQRD
jgi:DNA-binding GntR family transcriptional regulator